MLVKTIKSAPTPPSHPIPSNWYFDNFKDLEHRFYLKPQSHLIILASMGCLQAVFDENLETCKSILQFLDDESCTTITMHDFLLKQSENVWSCCKITNTVHTITYCTSSCTRLQVQPRILLLPHQENQTKTWWLEVCSH